MRPGSKGGGRGSGREEGGNRDKMAFLRGGRKQGG